MLMVIDVGNTNMVFGIYDNEELINLSRFTTDRNRTSDELGIFTKAVLRENDVDINLIDNIAIASVVPNLMYSLENMCKKFFDINPYIINHESRTRVVNKYENPAVLGVDRLMNATSAYKKYNKGVIVADFGTATKIDCVSEKGEFLGGIITAGIKIQGDALFEKTAKLPKIEYSLPDVIIGKNTIECMQLGIILGHAGMIENIVNRYIKNLFSLEKSPIVIATGGMSWIFDNVTEVIDVVDPYLTLDGIKDTYQLNHYG